MRVRTRALLSLIGMLLFVIGYLIGSKMAESHNPQYRDAAEALDGADQQVADAIRRWSLKSAMSEKDVRRDWSPRAMFIPTRNQGQGILCIELHLQPGNLGGSPVYCYQDDFLKPNETLKLVAEYSDVE